MARPSFLPVQALALVSALAFLGAAPASAAEPPHPKRLALTELKPGGLKPDLVRTLTDVLLEALRARSGMRVMGRSEVELILEHEGQKQLMGCTDDSCEANLAAALKADLLCNGSLGLVGTTYLVNLSLTDVATARVTARASATAMAEGELVAAVQRAAEDLIAPADRRNKAAAPSATASFKLTGKTSLAMLDLTASGLEPQVVDNLTQVVVDELKNLPKASLISRDEIRALFSHTRQQQLVGCDDAGCLSELGGALGVDYLVSGNVGRVGDTYLLHLKLISIKGAKIANRVAESFVGEESQLIGATRFAARSLVGLPRDGEGKLEVPRPVSDARLIVDGKPVEGAASVQALQAGKYNLRLEADGYAPWFSDVYVDAGSLTRVNATMKEIGSPVYKKWWLWTVVGVVVAGGAATAAVLATKGGSSESLHPFDFQTSLPQR
ncbi:MAG TPA: PEGA domain-containing protein [Myxococcales bacterium]